MKSTKESVLLEGVALWKGLIISGRIPNSIVNTEVCDEMLAVISRQALHITSSTLQRKCPFNGLHL